MRRLIAATAALLFCLVAEVHAREPFVCMPTNIDDAGDKDRSTIRFATYDVALQRSSPGQLISDLQDTEAPRLQAVAEVVQRTRPDVLMLNGFDYDSSGAAVDLFLRNFLFLSQNGQTPIEYPYVFIAPSNRGMPAEADLDQDGEIGTVGDLQAPGDFAGQGAMVLLSKHRIFDTQVRTFQTFLWKDMPNARLPQRKDAENGKSEHYFSEAQLAKLRLSSSNHIDIPLWIRGRLIHILAANPISPLADGDQTLNDLRNYDEIRFWADYLDAQKASYIYDDNGRKGGIRGTDFVIMGNFNVDPVDGESADNAVVQLLDHPFVDSRIAPGSLGSIEAADLAGGVNDLQQTNSALDTVAMAGSFIGNLRTDYVLPSKTGMTPFCGGVFWPSSQSKSHALMVEENVAIPHRLVWMDVEIEQSVRW